MKEIKGIDQETLDFILEISKSAFPKEMAGLLKSKEGIITDVILAPGTYTSDRSAIMRLDRLPVTLKTIGSVHSHPSGNPTPSSQDLELFSKKGKLHIITGHPYEKNNWVCYNKKGKERELEILETNERGDDLWEKELKRLKEEENIE